MKDLFILNQDAMIAWMFVMECHKEYGSLDKGGVSDLAINLMRHYPTEFTAIQMVNTVMRVTDENHVEKEANHGI
jgi:hypothetical protein